MAEVQAAPGAVQNPAVGTEAHPAAPVQAEVVTKAEFTAFQNQLFAKLRTMEPKAPAHIASTPASGDEATLTNRVQKPEEGKAKYADKRVGDALRDAAREAGVPAQGVEAVVRYLRPEYAAKLTYDEDADTVSYFDIDPARPEPVKNLIAGFLKTDTGKIFLPAPSVAGAPRGTGGGAPLKRYADFTPAERLKMTDAERWALAQREMNGS